MMIKQINQTVPDKMTAMVGKSFDLEAILPLDMIRQHTKTEDIISVSDAQLSLYRRVAIEAAEKYTGMVFKGQRVLSENVYPPMTFWDALNRDKNFFYHTTQYMFAGPWAYLYGSVNRTVEQLMVTLGSNTVRIRYHPEDPLYRCCDPCDQKEKLMLQYTAGYQCEDDIPGGVALGALKYIAHVIENPGDSINRTGSSGTALGLEANNPAIASGAIDIWRVIWDDLI